MDPSLLPALHDALVVAQTSSVGEAARRLGKTPSAISQQLRRIEDRFGVRLFEKAGRGIRPSAAGEAVLGTLTRLFDEAASLETVLGELAAARVRTVRVAANDSLGLCVFGQSVTNTNVQFLADTLNAAHGTSLTTDFFEALGRETLKLEAEFNRQAGFTEKGDELPAFFYSEPVPPTNHVARFHGADVHGMYARI
jgi:aldehyde:ferredoxin oxidoreductase